MLDHDGKKVASGRGEQLQRDQSFGFEFAHTPDGQHFELQSLVLTVDCETNWLAVKLRV